MAKDRKRNGKTFTKSEKRKHDKRMGQRKKTLKVRNDGAGARDLQDPTRHRRSRRPQFTEVSEQKILGTAPQTEYCLRQWGSCAVIRKGIHKCNYTKDHPSRHRCSGCFEEASVMLEGDDS